MPKHSSNLKSNLTLLCLWPLSLNLPLLFLLYQGAEKDMAEAMKRQKELENVCMEQAVKIEQLNHLVIIYCSLYSMEYINNYFQYSPVK